MTERKKIRVFLVDDVRELRRLVRLTLEEDAEIEVVGEASDGRGGVEGVAETQPDVVLLDLSMPDMDGLEALPLMRERAPNARLVVLSGHEAGRVSLESLDQGATRYLNKASDLEAIRSAVREVARLEPPVTDERIHVVRRMWTAFLNGAIDEMLNEAHPDATWRPHAGAGRELHSQQEVRSFLDELKADGQVVDPRAYGVEPHGNGLIVMGTLEIRGRGGRSETEVYWVFCFRGAKISVAAGFDQRVEALQAVRKLCGSPNS
jgi:DNA-binding NarL/FixJ family response regulator